MIRTLVEEILEIVEADANLRNSQRAYDADKSKVNLENLISALTRSGNVPVKYMLDMKSHEMFGELDDILLRGNRLSNTLTTKMKEFDKKIFAKLTDTPGVEEIYSYDLSIMTGVPGAVSFIKLIRFDTTVSMEYISRGGFGLASPYMPSRLDFSGLYFHFMAHLKLSEMLPPEVTESLDILFESEFKAKAKDINQTSNHDDVTYLDEIERRIYGQIDLEAADKYVNS